MTNANDPWGTGNTNGNPVSSDTWNPPTDTPVVVSTSSDANYATAIIRAGGGYGAPNVSFRGADATDLRNQIKNQYEEIKELMTLIGQLGKGFAAVFEGNGNQTAPAQNQRPNTAAPAGASEGPGPAPMCNHGAMVWRSGVSQAGKAYKLWSCTERDRSQQCKPVYPN